LGYDQTHAESSLRTKLDDLGYTNVAVTRVEGLEGDLDGTRKIIARILERAEPRGVA